MSTFKIGYARVSTHQQEEALQLDALQRAQVDRVFLDRASGTLTDRPGPRATAVTVLLAGTPHH